MATLLTGVGYIGATLLRRLLERNPDASPVLGLDNFYSTPRALLEAALPPGTHLIEGDVANPDDVARAFDQLGNTGDLVVYHLAAQPSAALAAREPEVTERSNLLGARVVLEAARSRDARVIFGGSFRVYGDDLANRYVDEDTPYGRVADLSHLSKVYVEQLARMLGVRFVSVRLGVTYGLSPIMKRSPAFMTVPNLFCQRAACGQPLNVLEDRPMAFIHVQDAAEALLQAAETPAATWSVVNAAPEVASIGQVARTVQRLASSRDLCVPIDGAASCEASFHVGSRLGMKASHSLDPDLGEVLDLFMQPR